jgi:putative peptidoglycan lipid II flippase
MQNRIRVPVGKPQLSSCCPVKSSAVTSPPSTQDPQPPAVGAGSEARPPRRSPWTRALGILRPSHAHSVFSATVLLMFSTFLSRIIGLVRVKYIAWLLGSGMQADAFNAAFVLPDMISYFLVGGAASITFVTILTRYRESGREAEGERSLSVILTTMYLVLGAAIVFAEILAPWYVRWWFNGFDSQKAALCVLLTRILLPAQLCFFAGGVFGAVLLVRKQFSVQAVAPLIYGVGTIVGGVLLVKHIGVSSLAIGTVAGAFVGPFFLNAFFARRAGVRYRMILDWRDEGLREWVRLSLPLMAGVSLVTADSWIIGHFASKIGGAVTLFNYAKQFFTAPMAMLAQAAGAASMPFFASLWTRDRRYEFANTVADSVSRVASLGLLAASGMIALGWPAIDLVMTGGRFSSSDSRLCAFYFAVFSISLFLWSAQAIYARAFYAAGNTFVPMVASTIVTLVSLPIYAMFDRWFGMNGLAIASNIGIALQTLTIAVLLHKRHMVSLASLDFAEMGRCILAAAVAGAAAWLAAWGLRDVILHLPAVHWLHHARWNDAAILVVGLLIWAATARTILEMAGSALPKVVMRRLRLG